MKNLIITGGAGFIGSNAVDYFVKKDGYQVTAVIDKLTYAADVRRIKNYTDMMLYKFDVAEANLEYMFEKENPDVIVHFAAESHVDNSILADTTDDFIKSNYVSVAKLVNAIRHYKMKTHRNILLVHISTDEVLGDMPMDSDEEYDECQPLRPNNPYAATKAAAEQIIQAMHHTHKDFDYTILRATNNYGPAQHFEKFIPTVIKSLLQGKKIPIYGSGWNVREWLWTSDFINGIDKVISQYYQKPTDICGQIFHFGSGYRITNLGVVNTILTKMGLTKTGTAHEMIESVPDRPGHDRKYALNCQKAKSLLNWSVRMPFENGIGTVITDIEQRVGELK